MSKKLKERSEEIDALVLKSQNGDQEAFAALYDIFVDPIYRYIFFKVKDREVEDLVEDVFVKVWRNIKKYEKRKGVTFSAWVFRIAHNIVVDYYRTAKNREYDELPEQIVDHRREKDTSLLAEREINKDILAKALSNIKESYREIIVHKYLNDLSNKEIADLTGKTEGSLRILQFRALKALRGELKHLGMKY